MQAAYRHTGTTEHGQFLPGSSRQALAAQQTQRAIQTPTGDGPEAPGTDAEKEENKTRRHVAQKAANLCPSSPRCLSSTMRTNLPNSRLQDS